MFAKHLQKTKRAYSLIEVVVTLVIVNVVILMVSNILVMSIKMSNEARERSFVREELSKIMSGIRKDIRNANYVKDTCVYGSITDGTTNNPDNANLSNKCEMLKGVDIISWESCTSTAPNGESINSICKYTNSQLSFKSSNKLNIDAPMFQEVGGVDTSASTEFNKITIAITLRASHFNPQFEINNIYRHEVVSTRNFSQ